MNVIIIGGGQVGAYVAGLLLKNNCTVKVIENRESVFEKIKNELPPEVLVFGNGTDPSILESCGITEADVVAAVTGADEANLVASTIAKFEFNVPRVIARVNNPQNSWLFNAGMGVDVGLNQADLMAHIVVEEMNLKNVLTLMKMSRGNYSIVQVKVDSQSATVNKAVKNLDIPADTVLIAVYHDNGVVIPHGDTIINAGDEIIAFTDGESQEKLNTLFGAK
ncbi:MAG: TrkA family potassium uptake protein [Bacillota bacterium]|nr:TrkA family potassium uptake protein [Bacillota bacterium]